MTKEETPTTLTLDVVHQTVEKLQKLLVEEPFFKFMREHGFDPKDGCRLVLPEAMRVRFGESLPEYVSYSMVTDELLLLRPDTYKY